MPFVSYLILRDNRRLSNRRRGHTTATNLGHSPNSIRHETFNKATNLDQTPQSAARDIPQKFEDKVERTFRRFCADAGDTKTRTCAAKDAFFYRPKEKAGEVWGIFPDRAKAWLDAKTVEVN